VYLNILEKYYYKSLKTSHHQLTYNHNNIITSTTLLFKNILDKYHFESLNTSTPTAQLHQQQQHQRGNPPQKVFLCFK